MNKRAQAAVETLMIYGVTIFIVMLAIGALIGFGVIDLGRLLPDKCDISNALSCENYNVGSSNVQLELKNILSKNIQAFVVDIEGEGNDIGIWNCDPGQYGALDIDGDNLYTGAGEFDAGNGILVHGVISDVVSLNNCDIQVPSGRKINGLITLHVWPVGSKINQTVTGTIRATVS